MAINNRGGEDRQPRLATIDRWAAWRECQTLVRQVRQAERGSAVISARRPRGLSGFWSARAPLAVQLLAATGHGTLLAVDDADPSRGFCLVEPPIDRVHTLAVDRRTSVARALDTWWDVVILVVPTVLVMAVGTALAAWSSRRSPLFSLGLAIIILAAAWVLLALWSFVIRSAIQAVGVIERPHAPHRAGTAALLATNWRVTLLHATTPGDTEILLDLALPHAYDRWVRLPRRAGDEPPRDLVVDLDAVTTQRAEDAIIQHRSTLCEPFGSEPRVVVLGESSLETITPRRPVPDSPAKVTWLILWTVLITFLAARQIWEDQAIVCQGLQCASLDDYPTVLRWTFGQLFWQHSPLSVPNLKADIVGWGLRLLGLGILGACAVAIYRVAALDRYRRRIVTDQTAAARETRQPTIGIVTALPEEFAAMRALLEDGHEEPQDLDGSTYILGTLPSSIAARPHHVVVTQLTEAGNSLASAAGTNVSRTFPGVNHVIMCGIACGVPRPDNPRFHVRLGDVVCSTWGIVAYDHADVRPTGMAPLSAPPRAAHQLVSADRALEANEILGDRPWDAWIDKGQRTAPGFARPAAESDIVYVADDRDEQAAHPDPQITGHLPGRPKIHHGSIGSADKSLRSIAARDEIALRDGILALEMEGEGIATSAYANGLGWIAVRGISDYGDLPRFFIGARGVVT